MPLWIYYTTILVAVSFHEPTEPSEGEARIQDWAFALVLLFEIMRYRYLSKMDRHCENNTSFDFSQDLSDKTQ